MGDDPNTDACENPATEQFVYEDRHTGLIRVSLAHCGDCSRASQPPETLSVFDLWLDTARECEGERRYQ